MTEEQKKEYHAQVDENIKKVGYHITFVFADKAPSFCYSTGMYKSFGIPEIFISSLPQNLSFKLVENYLNKFKELKSIQLNKKIDDLTDRFPIYLIDVPIDILKDYVLSTIRLYNCEEYKYVQLIYPDTNGRFPNDLNYDYDQEIMGVFKS
jgi:hypothetical protein